MQRLKVSISITFKTLSFHKVTLFWTCFRSQKNSDYLWMYICQRFHCKRPPRATGTSVSQAAGPQSVRDWTYRTIGLTLPARLRPSWASPRRWWTCHGGLTGPTCNCSQMGPGRTSRSKTSEPQPPSIEHRANTGAARRGDAEHRGDKMKVKVRLIIINKSIILGE